MGTILEVFAAVAFVAVVWLACEVFAQWNEWK